MSGFADPDAEARPARLAEYLRTVSALPAVRAIRAALLEEMDPRPGERWVDLGCGLGETRSRLSSRLQPGGLAVGLDLSRALLRYAEGPRVQADAHALPIATATLDGLRVERVLMHVRAPVEVLREALRVLRPGGRLAIIEPDWNTLRFAGGGGPVADAVADAIRSEFRHPGVGGQLAALAQAAGFAVRRQDGWRLVFRSLREADQVVGVGGRALALAFDGALSMGETLRWLGALRRGAEEGVPAVEVTGYGLLAQNPEGP